VLRGIVRGDYTHIPSGGSLSHTVAHRSPFCIRHQREQSAGGGGLLVVDQSVIVAISFTYTQCVRLVYRYKCSGKRKMAWNLCAAARRYCRLSFRARAG